MSTQNPEISLMSPADYVNYYLPVEQQQNQHRQFIDNHNFEEEYFDIDPIANENGEPTDRDDGDVTLNNNRSNNRNNYNNNNVGVSFARASSFGSSAGAMTNSTPSMSLTAMTSRSNSMVPQLHNNNNINGNGNGVGASSPSIINYNQQLNEGVSGEEEVEYYSQQQQQDNYNASSRRDEAIPMFDLEDGNNHNQENRKIKQRNIKNGENQECETTAQELERILSPMKEKEALLHASRLNYIQENSTSKSFISGDDEDALWASEDNTRKSTMKYFDLNRNTSDDHDDNKNKKKNNNSSGESEDNKIWISEKEEENIRSVVKSIEMQMHIKELHQKEMDLMRLTGAEMEDMVEHQSDYQYAEYIKALLAARSAEDEEQQQQQQQRINNSSITSGDDAARAFINRYSQNGNYSQSTMDIVSSPSSSTAQQQQLQGNGNNSFFANKNLASNPSVLTLKDTILMRSAENRKRPRLFDIVAAKPPSMKDVPGMRNYLIMDELPPDPELTNGSSYYNNNNEGGAEMKSSANVSGRNDSSQAQNRLPSSFSKMKEAEESQKRRELNAVRVFASEYAVVDANGPLSSTSTGVRENSSNLASQPANQHHHAVTNNSSNDEKNQMEKLSAATKTMVNSAQNILVFDDGEEKTVAERQNERFHALIASSDSAAKIRHEQLKPISGVLTTFQAASPQLFDINRHNRHRSVFTGAMQNWRDKKADEEQQAQLAGIVKQNAVLDQYSPLGILQRRGVFTNKSNVVSPSSPFSVGTNNNSLVLPPIQETANNNNNNNNSGRNIGKIENKITSNKSDSSLLNSPIGASNSITLSGATSFLPPILEDDQVQNQNARIKKPCQTLEVDERPPPRTSSDLRSLLAEQQKLIRKAEKDDVETYRPMVKNFLAYNEMMAERMWASLGGK